MWCIPRSIQDMLLEGLSNRLLTTSVDGNFMTFVSGKETCADIGCRLSPHEGWNTDVILLAHSMGGIIAGEVELLPAVAPTPGNTFRHRIIGTINFDVPFLGMHPSVVGTGIGSIFRPAPPPADQAYESDGAPLSATSTLTVESSSTVSEPQRPSRVDTLFAKPTDPNFNPKFTNDVILPMRKGWANAMHFMNKHSDNLRQATKQLVKSHVEFGGTMADYSTLRLRYMRVRALDDEDTSIRQRLAHVPHIPARVRFVNYYTASTGRKKKPKSRSRSRSKSPYGQHLASTTTLGASTHHLNPSTSSLSSSGAPLSPRISVSEQIGDSLVHKGDIETGEPLTLLDSIPEPDSPEPTPPSYEAKNNPSLSDIHVQMPMLPPLPPGPTKPGPLDFGIYSDPAAQEIIRRDHERRMRAYEQAIEDREAAEQDRKALEYKLKQLKVQEITKSKKGKENNGPSPTPAALAGATPTASTVDLEKQPHSRDQELTSPSEPYSASTDRSNAPESLFSIDREESRSVAPEAAKRKKDRKFCALPKKINGERDPLWVRVYMENHDEVSAHTGLFYMSETYERLVGDVGAKIEEWVRDDMTRRLVEGYAE